MSIFTQFLTAIYRFRDYPKLLKLNGLRVFIYFILFSFLFGALMLVPVYRAYHIKGGLVAIAQEYLPEFEFSNYELSCDYITSSDSEDGAGMFYVIDTENPIDTTLADNYSQAIIAGKTEIYYKNNTNAMTENYKRIFDIYGVSGDISKDSILQYLCVRSNRLALLVPFALTFVFTGMLMLFFTGLWFVLLTTLVNNLIMHVRVRFSHIVKLCIHSLTFPSLLRAILLLVGLRLPSLIYTGLLVFYIYTGLKNAKNADFGKKGNIPEDGIVIAEL
jgi:hypothetical protein